MPGRTDAIEDYRYGFNGKEREDEIFGSGNSYDFGDRNYDPRIGRWNKVDSKSKKLPSWSPYHFGFDSPIITVDPDGRENIVIAGGQYDNSTGSKLMFVHQALRQLRQYEVDESDETRTLVLFTEGYTEKQIRKIEKAASRFGATVVKLNSSKDLTNYLNSKSTSSDDLSTNRIADPATNIDIFAHGVVGSIEFGYKQKNESDARFDKNDVARLNSKAFESGAVLCSYACRTGLGNANIDAFVYPWEDLKEDQSLAQDISNGTGLTVKAYLKRTDYSNTLSSREDRVFLKMYDKGLISGSGAGLLNMYLQSELSNREIIDNAAFDPDGAMHPVKSGDTPYGVSDEIKTYTPKK
jgi:RHS repeat-associated protein